MAASPIEPVGDLDMERLIEPGDLKGDLRPLRVNAETRDPLPYLRRYPGRAEIPL